ncbi:MAG: hypothetical protein ACYDAK_11375 [Candidatus Limnocylindrales bacterium]
MAEQVGDPLGIPDVGLAAGDGLDVGRVDDEELEGVLEDVVDRLPERTGALSIATWVMASKATVGDACARHGQGSTVQTG